MPASIDQLLIENIRFRDLVGRFVSLTQEDILCNEGLALAVRPTIAGAHGALLQEARLALGMDVWIPGWLQDDEQDEASQAASKAPGLPLKPAKKLAPTTPPGDATNANRNIS